MTEIKNGGELGQLDFDAEAHKQELEKYLDTSFDEADPSNLFKAQLEHLGEATTETETTSPKQLGEKNQGSVSGLIEWAQSYGLLPKEGESEGEYVARIRLAKYKSRKPQKGTKNTPDSDNEDQGDLF